MAKNKNTGIKDSFSETCSSIISGTISFFILLLAMVFPLVYHNSYFDILETKYQCYYLTVIGMCVVVLVLGLIMLLIDRKEYGGEHARQLFAKLAPKNWRTTFCLADGAVIAFWVIAVISTLQSEYMYEAFWGNEGRYTGLFLLTLYVASYFLISRFWTMKGWLVEAFLVSGMIMCLIGITDYFQMDILQFRTNIKPEQSTIFTSTIGNINTYTAYLALIMGVSAGLFATARTRIRCIWYYLCMVTSFFAIIMGCSDNAYLAIGALFAFLPFLLFQSRRGIVRYLVVVASFATVIQCIDFINQSFAGVVIGLDSLFQVLVTLKGLPVLVIGLWALAAASYFVLCRGVKTAGSEVAPSAAKMVWGIFLAVCVLLVCFALFDANALGNGDRYGALKSYLVFNDSWGTNRGYIWKESLKLYQNFPLMHKLFGYGPDTFGILTVTEIRFDMINATGQVFDSAHNEYLQYLVTIGPIGLAAYVAFLAGAGYRMARRLAANPYVAGCLLAVLCYGVQALVNLNLPIATPIMWLLLSVGMASVRMASVNGEEGRYEK